MSGVDFLPAMVGALPSQMLQRFDVVAFDPPGVGRSDPVVCGTGAQLDRWYGADPAPPGPAGVAALVAADRSFAAGCEARSGLVLPYVSTAAAAADLQLIRAALGGPLTYLGFSYGTLLGATALAAHSSDVRAVVLDGAVDPALGAVAFAGQQAASLERELGDFLRACVAGQCGWDPAGSLLADYQRLVSDVRARPLVAAGQVVGPAVVLFGTAAALYAPASWPLLGRALSALGAGNGAPIVALFDGYVGRSPDGSYNNTIEAESAVDCLDTPVPPVSVLRADAPAAAAAAPVFGLLELYGWLACDGWPVPATGHPGTLRDRGGPPVVVVGTTGDPVTPYAWARALVAQLGDAVLLTRQGYGHTAYFSSGCIRGWVDSYLLTGRPPPAGTTCPAG